MMQTSTIKILPKRQTYSTTECTFTSFNIEKPLLVLRMTSFVCTTRTLLK